MARLIGVDLPRDKRLEIALTYIYGIGKTRALQTLEATQISGDLRVHQLTTNSSSHSATGSRPTTRSKVIFVARWPPTSGARSRSAPTRDAVTAVACPYAASAPAPTPAPARARANPSPARRRPSSAT